METKPVITCLKTLLIVYSFVFWITGAILLAVGVWGKLMLGPYISLIADNSTNAPYVLIGTGTVIIVFGLFGCFATCRGSPWMLKLYAMFLSLVFLAELVAGISGFVFRHEIKGTFRRTYTDAVLNYNTQDEASRAVDYLQNKLRCCGVYNYTSWFASVYYPAKGIPPSCCFNSSDCSSDDLRNATVAPSKVYHQVGFPFDLKMSDLFKNVSPPCTNTYLQILSHKHVLPLICTYNMSPNPPPTDLLPVFQGCFDLVTSFMETNMAIIAGVTFGIAFSQLIGMLLACCLSRIITANQYEMV
uniref:Tetraspanin n=1 Tax=Oryzias latipes TaxID=8090 RepID=A0A3P9M768_ORYLA